MSALVIGCRGLSKIIVVASVVVALGFTAAQGANARAAKDAGEQSKAVTAATRYLQGPGFIDPMVAAVSIEDRQLSVQVDRGWARMNKAQKIEFLEKINGEALSASGGIAMDIQVSVSGARVAASTFAAGQQSMRLLAE